MATLKTTLTLDGGQFQRGLMMAERAGKRFNRQFLAPTAELTRRFMRLGVAAAAAGAAIGGFVTRHIMRYGDELDKMSHRVGVSTEFLAKLGHAATTGGTSLQAMEVGIRRMQRTAYDVTQGTATAIRAFDALGVSVRSANGELKPTEQLFMETATAMAALTNNTEKAALATIVFGRAGTQLLPMLQRRGEMAQRMANAERWGLVMTQRNIEAAVELRNKFADLRAVFTGLMIQLPLEGMANAISRVTNAVAKLRHNVGFRQFVKDVVNGTGQVIAAVASITRHVYRFVIANRQFFQQWGLILLGAALMFKTGLAQPIILLAYNVGRALVLSLAGAFHFVATHGIRVAILHVGKFMSSLALMGVAIGGIVLLFRHWKDVVDILGKTLWKVASSAENRFRQLWIDMREGAKAAAAELGVGEYTAADQKRFDEMRRVAREVNRRTQEELDRQILESGDSLAKGVVGDIDAAVKTLRGIAGGIGGAFKMPSFERIDVSQIFGQVGDLPGVKDLSQPVANGVARGMMRVLNTSFGKVWMGDTENRERRISERRMAKENQAQLNALKSQTDLLREMARAGALVF